MIFGQQFCHKPLLPGIDRLSVGCWRSEGQGPVVSWLTWIWSRNECLPVLSICLCVHLWVYQIRHRSWKLFGSRLSSFARSVSSWLPVCLLESGFHSPWPALPLPLFSLPLCPKFMSVFCSTAYFLQSRLLPAVLVTIERGTNKILGRSSQTGIGFHQVEPWKQRKTTQASPPLQPGDKVRSQKSHRAASFWPSPVRDAAVSQGSSSVQGLLASPQSADQNLQMTCPLFLPHGSFCSHCCFLFCAASVFL